MRVLVVKCQRSLFTSKTKRQMLFYTDGKEVMGQWNLNARWNALFDIYSDRFFAEVCWYDSHGGEQPPDFLKKLPEQGW